MPAPCPQTRAGPKSRPSSDSGAAISGHAVRASPGSADPKRPRSRHRARLARCPPGHRTTAAAASSTKAPLLRPLDALRHSGSHPRQPNRPGRSPIGSALADCCAPTMESAVKTGAIEFPDLTPCVTTVASRTPKACSTVIAPANHN
jgi:hypothetical protein